MLSIRHMEPEMGAASQEPRLAVPSTATSIRAAAGTPPLSGTA